MKNIFIFIFLVSITNVSMAQNIVPNPSFEDTSNNYLRIGIDYIPASNWSSFGNSPDFFYTGNLDFSGVPGNGFGFQAAHSGNKYCGFYSFLDNALIHPYREFIGVKLNESLKKGTRYFVNFKVSLADSANCGSNNLGAVFSNHEYSDSVVAPINNKAHIINKNIILEKNKWVSISGAFTADSNYQYLIIGNFFNDATTQRTILKDYDCTAYYYIDDVCVSTDSLLCNDDFDSTTIDDVILFPNPASEKITIESKQRISKDKLLFFDVLGKNATSNVVIQQAYDGHRLFVDVRNLASAMYVLRLIDAENNLHLLKFIKQ
ncbi:MAG: hypothetical protein RL708_1427 [Bacteroidota bacterium]|jgi:hypothetical protein